jgi:hypothetical protein
MTSTKTTREEDAYGYYYPSILPWQRLINVLEEGAIVEKGGKQFVIKQIIKPLIPGSKTRIVLDDVTAIGTTPQHIYRT